MLHMNTHKKERAPIYPPREYKVRRRYRQTNKILAGFYIDCQDNKSAEFITPEGRVYSPKARQKLMELETGLRQFEAKYGMSFETYRRLWESEDRPEYYTFEAENDYLMWEGLVTRRNRLTGSFAWLP